jgi:hypothetical protein
LPVRGGVTSQSRMITMICGFLMNSTNPQRLWRHGSAFASTLGWPNGLNVLDSKYGKVLTKKKNVPIIMIANELPKSRLSKGPLQARLMRMTFFLRISKFDEAGVIATFLWGCIQRRLHKVKMRLFRIRIQEMTMSLRDSKKP